ncbi:MAG: hypothetical protein L6R38_000802 [Xanthoria sp. 2 TBL-2021]|nr:MAG: hypothetical protein L6R38_000802 [Xanthoria sp. 2 TBL-2021]
MGICSSCLGRGRRDQLEDPETSRLLSDDPFRNYGSRAQPTRRPLDDPDPENVRQEREALETIAHGMSEDVVDIFTILPDSSEDVNQDRSGSPEPETNGFKEDDARAQSIAYRTVKRAYIDKISSPMCSSKHDWKDAKAAMG